jgi:hypothetical protein
MTTRKLVCALVFHVIEVLYMIMCDYIIVIAVEQPDTDTEEHMTRQKKQANLTGLSKGGRADKSSSAVKAGADESDDDYDSSDDGDLTDDEDEETKQKRRELIAAAAIDERGFPPTLLRCPPTRTSNGHQAPKGASTSSTVRGPSSSDADWEWIEDSAAEALLGVYEEIGEMSRLLGSLRREVKQLNTAFVGVHNNNH